MRKILTLLLVSMAVSMAQAQSGALFIFDRFLDAKIHFKNRSVTVAPMNYDAVNDKMFFKQNGELMELTNAAIIDSIVWSGKRNFVPYEQGFLEQVKMENGTVFIGWRIKNVNVGSRGALGAVTQGKVESISVRSMGVFQAEDADSHSADVYQQKNANEYFITVDSKWSKVVHLKHVYKLYPAHKEAIKKYVSEEKIKMNEPLSVLQLLNYCMGLK